MPDQQYDLEILIRTKAQGDGLKQAQDDAKGLNATLINMAAGFSVVKQGYETVSAAAQKAYAFISEGAELKLARSQFDNLSASIGTTSDSLLNELSAATKGMASDAQLVQGATDIINLGLADTQEGTVRLATAVSSLGLDMQQVILTFANNSKARLDALGLSVEGVTAKAAELEAQGFQGDAFDEAVLIGLEEKMTLLGDASLTTAGKLQIMESSWANLTNNLKTGAANALEPAITSVANLTTQISEMGKAADSNTPLANIAIALNEVNKAMGGIPADDFVQSLKDWERGAALTSDELAAVDDQFRNVDSTLSHYVATVDEVAAANRNVYDGLTETGDQLAYAALVAQDYTSAGEEMVVTADDLAEAEARRAAAIAATTEAARAQVGAFTGARSLAEELISAQDDLAASQGEWVTAVRSNSGEISAISAQLAGDLSADQKKAYQEILITVEEGSGEWLNAYNALQNDLSDSQRQALIAQQAELQAAGDATVSVYTGDAAAAEEAQQRIIDAQTAIQESYRATAFEALLAGAQTSEAFTQALEAGIATGAITEAQAALQQQIGGTNLEIQELNTALQGGRISTEEYATAFENLTTNVGASVEGAISSAQAITRAAEESAISRASMIPEVDATAVAKSFTESAAGAAVIVPEVDTTVAVAAFDDLAAQGEAFATEVYTNTPDVDDGGALGAINGLFQQGYQWRNSTFTATFAVKGPGDSSNDNNAPPPGQGRAGGGPVTAGESYLVGERGPEIFTPNKSGSILNNQQTSDILAGSNKAPVILNVTINGATLPPNPQAFGNQVATAAAEILGQGR